MQLKQLLVTAALCTSAWASASITEASETTKTACKELAKALPDRVHHRYELIHTAEISSYWSTALREAKPLCMVMPQSSEDVSAAVKVLNKYPDVKFAVKSGGHDPNPGHATIEDGVLISFRKLSGTTYDEEKGLAYIKPGGNWNEVVGTLLPHGVTVVGGRLGIVGIGGYLLQGGISFLSSQYGLAADSVVAWETVKPDGSIVNIDAEKEPELAVAMRGSGSQFGIVTEFTVKTHPIGEVWGGFRVYMRSQAKELYQLLHDFTRISAEDPKAAIIFVDNIEADGSRSFIVFYFYDGPEPPTSGPFAKFLEVSPIYDLTMKQSYASLLYINGVQPELMNARVVFRTSMLPYVEDAGHMYGEITDQFSLLLQSYLNSLTRATSQCSIGFQPLPSVVGKNSEAAGGNAMGIKGDDPHRIIVEVQCAWASKDDDEFLYGLAQELTDWIETKIPEWTNGKDQDLYLPLFMNDAGNGQNVTGSYRDYAKFKALQKSVDPDGFFSLRGGGFTY